MKTKLMIAPAFLIASAILFTSTNVVQAGTIRSATAVLQNTGGNFSGSFVIENVINQSGLATGFTSGVTDFDTYVAGSPTHTFIAAGNEWFTPLNVTSSTIILDMGAEYSISRIALWNEEFSGINEMIVQTSNDSTFGSFNSVGTFNPTISPANLDYEVEVLDLTSTTNARYVRLFVDGPQIPFQGNYVSMGEIAFDTSQIVSVIPEPGSLAIFGTICLFVCGRRRKS